MLPSSFYAQYRYAIERDNPLLDDAFADEPMRSPEPVMRPSASISDLDAEFDPPTVPGDPALPPKKKREPNPNAPLTKQHLLSNSIVAPLRGTRLAWHLLNIAKDHHGTEIADRARAALTGRRFGPESEDNFTKLGQLLSTAGDRRGSAYNWHRVSESLLIDNAVKKFISKMAIKDPTLEDQRHSLVLKHYGVGTGDESRSKQFYAKLKQFVASEIGHLRPDANLGLDRLDRSVRRLAYQEQDAKEIGEGPKARKQTAYIVGGHDETGRPVPGTVKPVASTEHPWRDYMSLLPGTGVGSSAERYARKPGSTTGNNPPPSGLTPSNVETLTRKQRLLAALRQAKRRLTRSSEPPEKLLPAVEDTLTKRGTLSHTDLARYTAMHGDKLTEVVDHGVKTGRLEVETRRPESGHGPHGRYVSLTKKYSAYKAPAGGMTYKGVYYNGGQLVPDVSKVQSTPNETPKPFTPRLPKTATPIDKSKFLSLLKSKIKSK